VMAHVHLPDGFALTLGMKTTGLGRTYQDSFFQANQTAGPPEKIRLGPHSTTAVIPNLRSRLQSSGAGNDVRSSDAYYHWGALLGVIELLEHGR
jgi:hypothetical protein